MKWYEDPPPQKWAGISKTDKFVFIESYAGYRGAVGDDKGYKIYLLPDTDETSLGNALLQALRESRFVSPSEEPGLYNRDRIQNSYKEWLDDLMTRYGYRSKPQALKNMMYCSVTQEQDQISMDPYRRAGMEEWEGLGKDKAVVVPVTATAAEVGAALRLTLSRCL